MSSRSTLIAKKMRLLRILSQIIFLILLNGAIIGLMPTALILPVEQPNTPYSTAVGAFNLLQGLFITAIIPFIAIAVILLGGIIFGRAFCAWACPFGLVQDIFSTLGYFIPIRQLRPNKATNKSLERVGLVIVGAVLAVCIFVGLSVFFGTQREIVEALGPYAREPFSVLNPSVTLFSAIPYMFFWGTVPATIDQLLAIDIIFWFRIIILVFAIGLPIFVPRGWCRWFCPTGACLGLVSKYSIFGIGRNMVRCTHCGDCIKACPMGVPILDYSTGRVRDSQCINCLECRDICPENAIEIKLL
ncbi:MAG: 4Fe-4S binding protein [Promethearchaeota archaeon]